MADLKPTPCFRVSDRHFMPVIDELKRRGLQFTARRTTKDVIKKIFVCDADGDNTIEDVYTAVFCIVYVDMKGNDFHRLLVGLFGADDLDTWK